MATYNALITLGEYPSFENVLSYYNQWGNNVVFGLLGIVPETVVKYFKQKGYKVIVSDNLDGIDIYSTTADACILWYTWIHDDGLPRAHFVHYNYDKGYSKYCAYNTNQCCKSCNVGVYLWYGLILNTHPNTSLKRMHFTRLESLSIGKSSECACEEAYNGY